ncbi:MAG TPA: TerC family protein [Verrucomicrobiae bacterium]|jgi:tellurite resistance protein TerC
MATPLLAWFGFGALVAAILALDLGLFHRKPREMGVQEAFVRSGIWIGLALLFNAGIYFWRGGEKAVQFFTSYTVEFSLSVDNLFVFLLIFKYFSVPSRYRHKVLFWGIIGALVMRAIFIGAGITLMEKFHWMIYLFGIVLVICGIKIVLERNREIHPDKNPVLKFIRRFIPVYNEYNGDRFFVKQDRRVLVSPLFTVLVVVESSDLLFALDSVPAVLAITPDPFIVYTSNVAAILGLRSLFFALEGAMNRFHYLRYGLSVILVFVGVKMLISRVYSISTEASLLVILSVLAISVVASRFQPKTSAIGKSQ